MLNPNNTSRAVWAKSRKAPARLEKHQVAGCASSKQARQSRQAPGRLYILQAVWACYWQAWQAPGRLLRLQAGCAGNRQTVQANGRLCRLLAGIAG